MCKPGSFLWVYHEQSEEWWPTLWFSSIIANENHLETFKVPMLGLHPRERFNRGTTWVLGIFKNISGNLFLKIFFYLGLPRGISQLAQWWRICLPSQETWVRSLVQIDSLGEGKGNPLQHSCLGNPMDRGARWASVHGVVKSQTRLSDWMTTTTFIYLFDCAGPCLQRTRYFFNFFFFFFWLQHAIS